jgi:hypothetical protein
MVDYRLSISDDFENLLRDLMECVLSPARIDKIDEMFSPEGKGAFFPTCIGAWRVHDVKDDLPRYMWDNPPVDIDGQEIWIVKSDPGGDLLLIEGDELRYLIKESKRMQEERDREFMEKYGRPMTTGAFNELRRAGII